jgi:hypothetical protein
MEPLDRNRNRWRSGKELLTTHLNRAVSSGSQSEIKLNTIINKQTATLCWNHLIRTGIGGDRERN